MSQKNPALLSSAAIGQSRPQLSPLLPSERGGPLPAGQLHAAQLNPERELMGAALSQVGRLRGSSVGAPDGMK